jgi:hypothetical protein
LPQKAREVDAVLKLKGFQVKDKKDHVYYFFYYKGKKTNIFTKISHGEQDIHDRNCSSMAKQMRLNNAQFRDFVDCALTAAAYLKFLLDSKHLNESQDVEGQK